MSSLRFCFLLALLTVVAHAVTGLESIEDPVVAVRNLLWWQTSSAVAAALVVLVSFAVLRGRVLAWAIAPTVLVGLEISAWLVSENFHHTLAPATRLLAFAGAWVLPAATFGWLARQRPELRWMTAVQIGLVIGAIGLELAMRRPVQDAGDRPDLALFVLDAVQARAFGHLGAPLDPSPRIDALAARGWTSDAAFASAATSIPGHAAILFGLDVVEHGAPTNDFDLPPNLPAPLAERLRDRGYDTMGFCHNPLVSRNAGFARGFDVWWNWGERSWLQSPVRVALLHWPAAYIWLRASDRDLVTLAARAALPDARGALFTFVQLLYTHDTYVDGDGWVNPERVDRLRELIGAGKLSNRTGYDDGEIAGLLASYLASVAYSDRLVGDLIELLEARAGDRGLVVVVTADHGENLAEHGDSAIAKHFGPWSTSLRIPLVVADSRVPTPGFRGSRLSSHQRVPRLFLDAADRRLPSDPERWGDAVQLQLQLDPAFIYSEPWLVLVDDSLKVAIDRTDLTAPPVTHRWREDFEDQLDVPASDAIRTRWEELLSLHDEMRQAGLFDAPTELDPEKLEHLRALGYIE
jgi:hypothetical protein